MVMKQHIEDNLSSLHARVDIMRAFSIGIAVNKLAQSQSGFLSQITSFPRKNDSFTMRNGDQAFVLENGNSVVLWLL